MYAGAWVPRGLCNTGRALPCTSCQGKGEESLEKITPVVFSSRSPSTLTYHPHLDPLNTMTSLGGFFTCVGLPSQNPKRHDDLLLFGSQLRISMTSLRGGQSSHIGVRQSREQRYKELAQVPVRGGVAPAQISGLDGQLLSWLVKSLGKGPLGPGKSNPARFRFT